MVPSDRCIYCPAILRNRYTASLTRAVFTQERPNTGESSSHLLPVSHSIFSKRYFQYYLQSLV